MQTEFYKYQATGNDFIIFDNRSQTLRPDMQSFYSAICDRRFGIGADGVMLLQNSPGHDFEMLYFNADGRPGSLCGNGSRCIVLFAQSIGLVKGSCNFLASDGTHEAIIEQNTISIQMKDVQNFSTFQDFYEIDTGSPHYVQFTEDIKSIDVKTQGARIRYNDKYRQHGINVNFVEQESDGISMRTYERGVEDETYSCGTGVTAAALIYAVKRNSTAGKYKIPVKVRGGDLTVSYRLLPDGSFTDIWLNGPAAFVFQGSIEISI